MNYFVAENSVVRKIWSDEDMILFIFAGASAEFALNKAVYWLYYTGKLPQDPLGRLLSTVQYAQKIIFAPAAQAHAAINHIAHIHKAVENQRGQQIPQWSYRDVLYMLIEYSVRVYEMLERPLTTGQKEEIYTVFYQLGSRMGIQELPANYREWIADRQHHLTHNLERSHYTVNLFRQYRRHLGWPRYLMLRMVQRLICPIVVKQMLRLWPLPFLTGALQVYKLAHRRQLIPEWVYGHIRAQLGQQLPTVR